MTKKGYTFTCDGCNKTLPILEAVTGNQKERWLCKDCAEPEQEARE